MVPLRTPSLYHLLCFLSYFFPTPIPLHQLDIQSGFFQHQIPTVSSKVLTLPCSICCALSCLCCNEHSTLATYLYRISQVETSSCSNCWYKSQGIFGPVLDCPALDSLCLAIFSHSFTILDLWSYPWRNIENLQN